MNRAVVLAMAVAGACAGSLACSSAFAQGPENDEGFYIGGGVGQFNVQIDDVDRDGRSDRAARRRRHGMESVRRLAHESILRTGAGVHRLRRTERPLRRVRLERRLQRRAERLRAVRHRHDPGRSGRAVRQGRLLLLRRGRVRGSRRRPGLRFELEREGPAVRRRRRHDVLRTPECAAGVREDRLRSVDDADAIWFSGQWRF